MVAVDNVEIHVGGITPFTTIDFPDRLAAVIFCQGCPWRCRYCHNRHLLESGQATEYTWNETFKWLETRRGLLDGVVFSGGEPLLQKQLPEAIGQVHQNGFEVALHTSGVYPDRLLKVLPLIEWVGLDIKAPFDEYQLITGGGNGLRTKESLIHILESGTDYELRCTVDPHFFNPDNAGKMAKQLMELGASRLVLQPYRDLVSRRSEPISSEIVASIQRFLPVVKHRH